MSETVTPYVVDYDRDLTKPINLTEAANWDTDSASAYWYAWGRMDQGHPAVVIYPTYSATTPCTTTTASHFGVLWANLQREFRDPRTGGYFPGLPAAWDHYVTSGGRTLRRA